MLLTWIAEIADEALELDPDNRPVEWETNTWWLSSEAEDRAVLSAGEVVAAFEALAGALRARVHRSGFSGVATFYAWHDEVAGQLGCSTGSVPPDALPFGGAHAVTDDLGAIVQGFLDDDEPGVVRCTDSLDTQEPLPVWARDVGYSAAAGR